MAPNTTVDSRRQLVLYVSGASPRSSDAVEAIRRLCDGELRGQVRLHVVDLQDEPAAGAPDHILAVPTLVMRSPLPVRTLVGDLTDLDRVRAWLDFNDRPRPARPDRAGAAGLA